MGAARPQRRGRARESSMQAGPEALARRLTEGGFNLWDQGHGSVVVCRAACAHNDARRHGQCTLPPCLLIGSLQHGAANGSAAQRGGRLACPHPCWSWPSYYCNQLACKTMTKPAPAHCNDKQCSRRKIWHWRVTPGAQQAQSAAGNPARGMGAAAVQPAGTVKPEVPQSEQSAGPAGTPVCKLLLATNPASLHRPALTLAPPLCMLATGAPGLSRPRKPLHNFERQTSGGFKSSQLGSAGCT